MLHVAVTHPLQDAWFGENEEPDWKAPLKVQPATKLLSKPSSAKETAAERAALSSQSFAAVRPKVAARAGPGRVDFAAGGKPEYRRAPSSSCASTRPFTFICFTLPFLFTPLCTVALLPTAVRLVFVVHRRS